MPPPLRRTSLTRGTLDWLKQTARHCHCRKFRCFRKNSTKIEKRNLLLVVVPHVIKDPSDLQVIHDRRRREYREFAKTIAQRKKEKDGELDYRKKNGLLENIHGVVSQARRERELREQLFEEQNQIQELGPPETHDIEYIAPEPPAAPAPSEAPAEGEE